jgi:DNA-binding protein HU-beta
MAALRPAASHNFSLAASPEQVTIRLAARQNLNFRYHTGKLSGEPLSTVNCLTLTRPRFGGNGKAISGSLRMTQSELIEKVAQATQLKPAAAGQAVKALVNAILDALVAGDAVRISGLGVFNVAARPAREGRNPQTGEAIQIAASKAVRFHAGKAVKDALNPPTQKRPPRKKTTPPKKSAVRK